MASEDWDRVKELFSAALGQPAESREAWLLEACADRPDLREAVGGLLAAHYSASSSFLEPGTLLFNAPWLFRTGDRIAARFDVVRPIARGATGEVYEVLDSRLRLRVALKALRLEHVGDTHTTERFRREVLVTRDIAHDGLCRIFDVIDHVVGPGTSLPPGSSIPCLTMQLLEGESLEDYLQTHRPLTPAQAFPILMQIAGTMDVLHDHGVVHRDLKPSNVMLVEKDGELRAVLTDFGLAKPLDESLYQTQKPVQGGAPFFMAPELFKGERPSCASDIYAFGLLLDEMVTRRRAFTADSLHSLMLQKLHHDVERPTDRADHLPKLWEHVILRCLARSPRERYRRATDACLALDPDRRDRWSLWTRRLAGARVWRRAAIAAAALLAAMGVVSMVPRQPSLVARSVVIQPFDNLTRKTEFEYLSVGTSRELGRRLLLLPNCTIYQPTVANAPDPDDPNRRAAFTIEGHVQQTASGFRIRVALFVRRTRQEIWAQNFDGTSEQAIGVQEAIGEAVAIQVNAAATRERGGLAAFSPLMPLFAEATPTVPAPGTTSQVAFDDYMRGRFLFEQRNEALIGEATRFLKDAIVRDPNYAAPYATLADLQALAMDKHLDHHDVLLRQAQTYAEQAVSLDPNLADAQLSLAGVRQMQGRFAEAEIAFKRAIDLHPRHARAHRWYGGMLLQLGRVDDALRLSTQALEIDPYDYPNHSAHGLILWYAGRPEEAVAHLRRLLAISDFEYGHEILGQVYATLAATPGPRGAGYFRSALAESDVLRQFAVARSQRSPRHDPPKFDMADMISALAYTYHRDREAATPFLAALEQANQEGLVATSFVARVYAAQGRTDDALRTLEAMELEDDRELMYLSVSPLYRGVRSDPRFVDLQRRRHLIP